MSDDQLDDEAPPDIPDISSDPEVAPIPALPSQIPPPSAPAPQAGARAKSDSDIEVEVEVEVDAEVPSEPGEEVEPEELPPLPPPRKRMQTNPATPVARASMPPPSPEDAEVEAPPPESLKPPRAPSFADDLDDETTRISDVEVESDLEKTVKQAPRELDDADLGEATTRMVDEPGAVRPILPLELPAPEPARPASQPPRPVSQPPRPVSQPPRPMSQPPRPVSQPPRPVSQPPPAPSVPPAPTPVVVAPPPAAPKHESEPPTQPWHAPPEQPGEGEHAATSYPPPPMIAADADEAHEHPPVSLKPMRVISVKHHSEPPAAPAAVQAAPAPPPAREQPPAIAPPPPPPAPPAAVVDAAEELSDEDFAPPSSEPGEEGDISFPADEAGTEARGSGEELTEDDIAVPADRESEPEIAVEVEEQKPAPPPPPRREAPKPPSVAEAKEAQRTKQRKAWWEELFGEDFARANSKLKSPQIVREADFIEESLGVAKGGVLLDLACGGGQHAVELAQRGYGVVGYDLSLYQLAVAADCAQEYGQKLNLLQGDMREMAFEEMFDGIYCWNTSFGYFEEEKNAAVAQRIFRALRPGGMFLLDVANRDFVVANQPSQTWFEGDACVCMDDMAVDFITSRLKVKRSLILDDGRTMECGYSIRLYSLHELGKILHDAGFRVTEASGHTSTPGVFFGASSPRIMILAQRP